MVSITSTLNTAYDVTESRPWWKTRLTAVGLTVGIAVFILASMFLIIAGPTVAENIAKRMQLGPAFTWTWMVLQWPIVFALVATAIGLVYYFAPDVEQDWVWITPGSIFATVLWLVVSLGLKFYYQMMPDANAAYGTIGAVMVLMLWFYVSGSRCCSAPSSTPRSSMPRPTARRRASGFLARRKWSGRARSGSTRRRRRRESSR